jgi:hypothetical protein
VAVKVEREQIAAALFAQLEKAKPSFKTFSRAVKEWTNVAPTDQPAFFLTHMGETPAQDQAWGITKYLIHYLGLVYFRADPVPDFISDQVSNPLLDALDLAMQGTPPGEKQTLGGKVENAWIEGREWINTGVQKDQYALGIFINVLTGV